MATSFKPIKALSKSKEVFQVLQSAILSGKLQPGESLKEAHLARLLNVSQVPVREALIQLEHLGLVLRVPDKGTTVTKLSRAEMVELLDVRAHLEDLAFRLAARRLTDKGAKELREHVANLEHEISKNNYFGAAEADFRFHRTVWGLSGNKALENALERLCAPVVAFVSIRRYLAKESLRDSVGQHKDLLKALESGQAKAISSAIREHFDPSHAIPSSVVD